MVKYNFNRGVYQLVDKLAHNQKVAGSNPAVRNATLAQLVEQVFSKDQVGGSIPSCRSTFK